MFNIDKSGKKFVEKKFSATGCFISVVIWVVLGFLVITKIGQYKKFPWEKFMKKIIINSKTPFYMDEKLFELFYIKNDCPITLQMSQFI